MLWQTVDFNSTLAEKNCPVKVEPNSVDALRHALPLRKATSCRTAGKSTPLTTLDLIVARHGSTRLDRSSTHERGENPLLSWLADQPVSGVGIRPAKTALQSGSSSAPAPAGARRDSRELSRAGARRPCGRPPRRSPSPACRRRAGAWRRPPVGPGSPRPPGSPRRASWKTTCPPTDTRRLQSSQSRSHPASL